MKYRRKIKNLLFQVGILGLAMAMMPILNIKYGDIASAEIIPPIIVNKQWLENNYEEEEVLFIQLSKDGPDYETPDKKTDGTKRKYPGYLKEHIITSQWGEAVQTPWDNHNGSPDVLIFTMKASARIKCEENPQKEWKCFTENNDPGMLAPLDPFSKTVAKEFEKMGISHDPSQPEKDIHIVIYAERLPHDLQWATTLYWLLEFYGYSPDKLHVLDGGLARWKADGGDTTSGDGPTIPPATFIPEVKPEIFADKTLVRAISAGLTKGVGGIKGVILDTRNSKTGNRPEDGGTSIEPGLNEWPADTWWDFIQGHYIENDESYEWFLSLTGESNKCPELLEGCDWDTKRNLENKFDNILGTNFNKKVDNIAMY